MRTSVKVVSSEVNRINEGPEDTNEYAAGTSITTTQGPGNNNPNDEQQDLGPTRPKTAQEQLAESAAAQRRRTRAMARPRKSTTWHNDSAEIAEAEAAEAEREHNLLRLWTISFAVICAQFGCVLLVIAGPEPPWARTNLIDRADVMRLLTRIYDRKIYITPRNPGTGNMSGPSRESGPGIARWPVREIEIDSENAILVDANYYAANYSSYKAGAVVLLVAAQTILLLVWPYLLLKMKGKLGFGRKSKNESTGTNRSKFRAITETLTKHFGSLKQFWNENRNFPPISKWRRASVAMITAAALMHCTLFAVLLVRPSMFTIVLHQVGFAILAVWCLGSTQLDGHCRQITVFVNPQQQPKQTNVKSLRTSKRSVRFKGNFGEESSGDQQRIFMTKQSRQSQQPIGNSTHAIGKNPFEDDDEEEEEKEVKEMGKKNDKDEQYRSKRLKTPTDEEAERERLNKCSSGGCGGGVGGGEKNRSNNDL